MFASQGKSGPRKIFQKPNILRKKTKPKSEASEKAKDLLQCADSIYSATDHAVLAPTVGNSPAQFKTKTSECSQLINLIPGNVTIIEDNPSTSLQHEIHQSNTITLFGQQVNSVAEYGSLNVESFLVDSPKKQLTVASSVNTALMKSETDGENKWCLNFMSDDSKDMVTPNFNDGSPNINKILFVNEPSSSQESSDVLRQDFIQKCLNSRVTKYKCDVPNCNKSFWSEARLVKHKSIHTRQKSNNTQSLVECPVKKVDSNGVEQQCGQLYLKEYMKRHLKEDHKPEDAAYKCPRCGRRFWWATGMRTHSQSPCTRALACTWPGCGRVFRQPCRLREHARAHTGDRPYPCDYPNCGWAFRSASKLMRHARRHTGERRHECCACGRAFPRREHLREHAARHHARAPSRCSLPDCQQTFTTAASLYTHLKKAHGVEGEKPPPKRQKRTKRDMFVLKLDNGSAVPKLQDTAHTNSNSEETEAANIISIPESEVVNDDFCVNGEVQLEEIEGVEAEVREVVDNPEDMEGRCARTHFTWPLQRHTPPEPAFTIEEDTQMEQQSEGSESNNYTVRSDLFLHGNVLINEDSEFIIRESSSRTANEAEETSGTGQLDGMDLIDHPTIDLMQEELMYSDAAVDESSFRVFLSMNDSTQKSLLRSHWQPTSEG